MQVVRGIHNIEVQAMYTLSIEVYSHRISSYVLDMSSTHCYSLLLYTPCQYLQLAQTAAPRDNERE